MEGAVVMGCDEPLARGGGAGEKGRPGLVWGKSGLPAGISRCSGLLLVGWRAAEVVTELSSGAKHGGTQGDTVRRFVQVGGRGGTGWDR